MLQKKFDDFVRFVALFVVTVLVSSVITFYILKQIFEDYKSIADHSLTSRLVGTVLIADVMFIFCVGATIYFFYKQWSKTLSHSREIVERTSQFSMLGEVAGAITHEINNPLAVILGLSDRLAIQIEKKALTDEEALRISERLQSNVKRIQRIITSMKSLSRSGEKDPVDLVSIGIILEESLALLEYKLKNKQIALKLEQLDKTVMIECRHVQFVQIFVNLMSNSIDAIEALPEKWIQIVSEVDHNHIRFKFIDSGKGIPEVVADQIMQPLFTTKTNGKGTGLGLSISKSIIENLGGTLSLHKEAANTTFVIELKKPILDEDTGNIAA